MSLLEIATRGVRVYPYPRVYPTRPVPAGTSRVGFTRVDLTGRVGSGRVRVRRPRVRVYPVLPVRNTIFHDTGARTFYFCMFSKLLMMTQLQYGMWKQYSIGSL